MSGVGAEAVGEIPMHVTQVSAVSKEQQCGSHLPVGTEAEDEQHSGHAISDTIKIADRVDADLSLEDAREEAVDDLRSKSAWADDTMDLSPLHKGTGKFKARRRTIRRPSTRLNCGKAGHRKTDCHHASSLSFVLCVRWSLSVSPSCLCVRNVREWLILCTCNRP